MSDRQATLLRDEAGFLSRVAAVVTRLRGTLGAVSERDRAEFREACDERGEQHRSR